MIHADRITGLFADSLHRFARATDNSLDRLDQYVVRADEFFVPPPTALPVVRRERRTAPPGFEIEHWSFRSPHEPIDGTIRALSSTRYERNQTVWVRSVRAKGKPPRGWLIYIHGWIQPETPAEELVFLTTMARALNLQVIHVQPPYHGRRTPKFARFGGELLWSADLVRSLESLRQTVIDVRTLAAMAASEVDGPLGIAGISLGGFFSLLLACLEPQLRFAIPMIAHMDLAALTRDAPVLGRMRRELAQRGFSLEQLRALMASLGWYDLRPLTPVENIQVHVGDNDRFFEPEVARDQFAQFGLPHVHWYRASHMGFIPRLPIILKKATRFLGERR